MIRDRLVVGIRDSSLSQTLQLDPQLTLEVAKKKIRQREAVQQQQQTLKGTGGTTEVEEVHARRSQRRHGGGSQAIRRNTTGKPTVQHQQSQVCRRCGKGSHSRDKCPAKEATCHRCQKKGHYSNQCLSKTVSELREQSIAEDYLDAAYLDTTTLDQKSIWTTKILLSGLNAVFKIDTGAEVTAISEQTFQKLPHKPQLNTPSKTLRGPSSRVLEVAGQFKSNLKHKNNESVQEVYVVKGLKNNLLGLPAITSLQIVS